MPQESLPTLYSVKEVAEAVRRSPYWLAQECRAGHIEHTLIGSSRFFTAEQAHAFIEAQKQPAVAAAAPSGRRSRSRRRSA